MMKKIYKLYTLLFAAMMMFSACEYDDTALNDRVDALEDRVAALEEMCNRINADMAALRQLVDALESQCYVTGVEPLIENGEEVGSVIRLSNGETVEIRNGRNGADGTDGEDGVDGYVPRIGTAEDTDGRLYWTLDGKWLLDENGHQVPVIGVDGQNGTDGQDGADGQNGTDGQDGVDGQDGICPLLKIVDGVWYCSLNGEAGPWIELGPADGADGQNGADGDTMFSEVIEEEDRVTIVMSDGQRFVLPKTDYGVFNQISSIEPVYGSNGLTFRDFFIFELRRGLDFGVAELFYKIYPEEAAAVIAEHWETALGFEIFRVPAFRATDFYDVPVTGCTADAAQGIIRVKVALPEEYLSMMLDSEGEMFGMLEVKDGETEVLSSQSPLTLLDMTIDMSYTVSGKEKLVLPECPDYALVMENFTESSGRIFFSQANNTIYPELFAQRQDLTRLQAKNVKEIAPGAFKGFKEFKYVQAYGQHSYLKIGAEAFAGSGLEQALLYTMSEIGDRAFADCQDLQKVEISGSAPELGKDVFPDHPFVIQVPEMFYSSFLNRECWKPYLKYVEVTAY